MNLADEAGSASCASTMKLLTWDEEQAAETERGRRDQTPASVPRCSNSSRCRPPTPLVTPEGKEALKKAIAERATETLEELKVTDVLFVEFVVQ